MTDHEADRARAELHAFVACYEQVVAAIKAIPDRQTGFDIATELGARISDLRTRNAQHRAELAHDIYRAESLSLAGLAKRIGVSRGRAQELVETARAAEQEEKPDE